MLSEGQPAMLQQNQDQKAQESDDDNCSVASSNTHRSTDTLTETEPKVKLDPEYEKALASTASVQKFMAFFVRKLKRTFDEVCTVYVDMYIDKEGPSKSDELSKQVLVFLLADEEVPQLKRDKKISEIVAEKIQKMRTPTPSISSVDTAMVSVQGETLTKCVGTFNLFLVAVPRCRKNICRSNIQVTFELYGHLKCLQVLYSK